MALHLYGTDQARIGKFKGEVLKRAMLREVLGITGQQKKIPPNNSDTVIYKRYLPYGGVDNQFMSAGGDAAYVLQHLTTEGVTPSADSITSVNVTAVLQEYAAVYGYSNRTDELHEDDIPKEMENQLGDRVGLLREMVRFGALKACTNVFYGGTGSSVGTVNGKVTASLLRSIKRGLENSHADMVTDILAPGSGFNTSPVEAAYLVFCHTDVESDIRDLNGFTPVAEYGNRKVVHPREIGSWESYRFITSPELTYRPAAGALIGATGLKGNTNIDVYQLIICGENAWGQVALRGNESLFITKKSPKDIDKSDILGQRGYVGGRMYFDCTILNDGWMALAHVGVTDL